MVGIQKKIFSPSVALKSRAMCCKVNNEDAATPSPLDPPLKFPTEIRNVKKYIYEVISYLTFALNVNTVFFLCFCSIRKEILKWTCKY